MGTKQITARVDEELLQDVASRIEAIKRESRGGVEINLATVIRYSLEKYLEEQEEIDKDIKTVKFNLKAITDKEKLEKLLKASEEIGELFKAGYEGEFETGIDCFYLSEAIRYRLFELNQKRDK
mgnify:CR=1 FL=1